MSHLSERLYGKDKLHTYKISFRHNDEIFEEYIHCFVIKWHDLDRFERPACITIKQVHNLQHYLKRMKGKTSERVLKTADLEYVHFPY